MAESGLIHVEDAGDAQDVSRGWEHVSLVPAAIVEWDLVSARRSDQALEGSGIPMEVQASSPSFTLDAGHLYVFHFQMELTRSAPTAFVLVSDGDSPNLDIHLKMTTFGDDETSAKVGFSYAPQSSGQFRIWMVNYYGAYSEGIVATSSNVVTYRLQGEVNQFSQEAVPTYLPNWGPLQRAIHRRCKSSRLFNSFVAAIEMRLGRDEVLSLPMYMALCPTGRCNALCEFCSVTINRTGIIKKQLSFEKIQRFLQPTLNTIYMYGLEGNGEPTLYTEFDSLLATLTANEAAGYLITNGALIKPEQVPHLLSLQSITFSLNAATAETHNRVMKLKLKEFANVTRNIKNLVKMRGSAENPQIFLSFVVNSRNVHELQRFLEFAEYELCGDVLMIRPLSELGDDAGILEDVRDIVPYESQVQDALDGAREYLEDVPRKVNPYTGRACEIRLDESSFKNVRPDPLDEVIMPLGLENRLCAPRRAFWTPGEDVETKWHLNSLCLRAGNEIEGETLLLRSDAMPVMPGRDLEFLATVKTCQGDLRFVILGEDGDVLFEQRLNGPAEIDFQLATQANSSVTFEIVGNAGAETDIDFGRLLTPGPGIREEFKLPAPRRWHIDTPGAVANWSGNEVRLDSGRPNLHGKYLLKSYFSPCSPNSKLTIPISVELIEGCMGIGVLSEDAQNWVAQFSFEESNENAVLEIDTGENRKIQVVLYSKGDDRMKCSVDWGTSLESPPDRHVNEVFEMKGPDVVIDENSTVVDSDDDGDKKSSWNIIARSKDKSPKREFYCPKPWTDLNNFTVDGRMDVCCITTGASQERYALGNLMEQDFQEVWNGAQMREFRRTVNSDEKLPPCERCPMSKGFQGPFFDPAITPDALNQTFNANSNQRSAPDAFLRRALVKVLKTAASAYFDRGIPK